MTVTHDTSRAVLVHSDVLVDRHALSVVTPSARARVMADRHGGTIQTWQSAYQQIIDDWDSYWADLNLSGDASLAHWREGRWRVVRALFRLVGRTSPPNEKIPFYLDELPFEIGCFCDAWHEGAVDGLRALAGHTLTVSIITPYLPAALVEGMLDAAGLGEIVRYVIGPDELGQVGSEGIAWSWLVRQVGCDPAYSTFVSRTPLSEARILTPPDDLAMLPSMFAEMIDEP